MAKDSQEQRQAVIDRIAAVVAARTEQLAEDLEFEQSQPELNRSSYVLQWRKNLKLKHQIILGLLNFAGITMIWIAVWGILPMTPVLREPWVAFGLGAAILACLGVLARRTL